MSADNATSVSLVDEPGCPRTLKLLLESIAARYAVLHFVSGAEAIGSITAGFAALGREVRKTSRGALLSNALSSGQTGVNGRALWATLRIGEWARGLPPTPVLDQLRNDVALLLNEDLPKVIGDLTLEKLPPGKDSRETEPVTFVDCIVGLWAFSSELVKAVEMLAGVGAHSPEVAVVPGTVLPEPETALLR